MKVETIPCDPANYGGLRAGAVEYLVLHYTANDGDTARGNGQYFAANQVGASAHWFVDESRAVCSVPEERVAWHCGGAVYRHPRCRNGNSIGIELCSCRDGAGAYCFTPGTLENAGTLTRALMAKYHIPVQRVLRHYDVTGKCCPAPFVGRGKENWNRFLGGLRMYQTYEEVPEWAKPTVRKLLDRRILLGEGDGALELSGDMVRLLVLLDRAGVWKEETT